MRTDASVSLSGAFHQKADVFHRWNNLSITKLGESTQCHLSISPLSQIRNEVAELPIRTCVFSLCATLRILRNWFQGGRQIPRQTNDVQFEQSTLSCIVLSVALCLMLEFRGSGQLQGTDILHLEQSALKWGCLGARLVLLGQCYWYLLAFPVKAHLT